MLQKLNLLSLLLVSAFLCLTSCKKTAIEEDLNPVDKTEITTQDPQFRAPTGGGNYTCYTAHLSLDTDCDFVFETGWNEETYTWSCCWQKVQEMAYQADLNGWCYRYEAETQCSTYACDNIGQACNVGPGGGDGPGDDGGAGPEPL